MRENQGKYCYPSLKIHLQGIQLESSSIPESFI